MKQRITINQLNELSVEQKGRLREWWKPKYGDFFSNGYWSNIIQSEEDGSIRCVTTDHDGCYDYERKVDCLPLLSIGQMIDLIGEKLDRISSPYGNESHIEPGQWKVWMRSGGFWDGETEELADALWEAVKESLEG